MLCEYLKSAIALETCQCIECFNDLNERKILLNYNNYFLAFKFHFLSMKKEKSLFEDQFTILKIIKI